VVGGRGERRLKGLSSEIFWLEMVSIDRSLSKGLAPRLLAVFHCPLSSERLFKFQCHLIRAFGIVETIAKAEEIFVAPYEREEKKK
jgi:hypothetical protein